MDTNDKLNKILSFLEIIIEKQQEQEEQGEELREAIANLSLPGSGYHIINPEED